MLGLCGFLLIIDFIVFLEYLTRKVPLIYKNILLKKSKDLVNSKKINNISEIKRFEDVYRLSNKEYLKFNVSLICHLICDVEMIQSFILFFFSMIGMLYHYFFFSYRLLTIILSFEYFQILWAKFRQRFLLLLCTIIIAIIFLSFYVLIAYYFFIMYVPKDVCTNLLSCYLYFFRNNFNVRYFIFIYIM